MNHAEAALYNNIDTPNVLFVFPTDIAVSRWADHLLRLRGGGTIAMNKFMAWDKFKQSAVKSKVQDKKSIPSSLRKIYVSSFIKENADAVRQNKEPLFSSLIKTQWAGQSAQFVPWLTGILPQLGSWFNKKTNTSIDKILDTETDKLTSRFEDDDKDLYTLTSRYALFMKEYSLFEPAWETPPFNDNGMKCFIFFPEALSDFREYRELLTTANNVTLISASSAGCENTKPFNTDTFYYTNSRSEITEASLFIRQLHEKHDIDWDSVVVCIPDSENYEPYVMREFANRNIPFVKRMGKPLADYPAGRFFQSVFECKTNVFSFTSVVALLMNNNLPWKHPELNSALIDFGIANNCLYSWTETEPKKQINIWEDAFTNPVDDPSNEVKNYFFKLKKHLTSLHSCLTFAELRISYFSFREIFFLDIDKCSDETNLIMARCVAELTDLIQLEKDFPKAVLVDPLLFIAEHLKETNYLAQSKTGGVTILPYKTAASVPYDYHIILGAQHEILSVVYTSLSFLPEKKREELGIKDEDASDAFINLHKFNSQKRSAFFCSEQTFSGYSIPHSKINAPLSPKNRWANDPEYKDFFSHDHYKQESEFCARETDTLEFIHEKQIEGFLEWKNRRENIFSQNKKPDINEDIYKYDNTKNYIDSIFRKLVLPVKPAKPGVSPTSMQDWYNCSLYWLFKRVFKLQNTRIETCLMDNIAGSVYHAVLNQFFGEIKKTGKPLLLPEYTGNTQSLPASYQKLLDDSISKIFNGLPSLPDNTGTLMSALTVRLLRAEKQDYQNQLQKFTAEFLAFFAGCYVVECEKYYQIERDGYVLKGYIDFILKDSTDKYIIVDFKLKNLPKRSDCTGEGENGLADFQLPAYITLAEENENYKVYTALFYSIIEKKPEVIIGTIYNNETEKTIPSRVNNQILKDSERYKLLFDEFISKTKQFADSLTSGEYKILPQNDNDCYGCEYNKICRTVYVIERENINSLRKT